jgi:hypothetical protein
MGMAGGILDNKNLSLGEAANRFRSEEVGFLS